MKNRGFTLIELIIVMALITLVSTAAYSVFGFANKTYKNGTEQYDIQSDQRIISDSISDSLKYAYNIEILNDISNESSVKITDSTNPLYGYNYIFLQYDDKNANGVCDDNEGIAIRKITFNPSTNIYTSSVISHTNISGLVYNLIFSYSGESTIKFDLSSSKDSKEKYSLNTKIDVMNAHLGSMPVLSGAGTIKTGKAIRFKLDPKTASPGVAVSNYPPAASNIVITGTASVNETLHGNYLYSDVENDPESGTIFRWESKLPSEPETAWEPIPGATLTDYILTISDYGMVIRFVVIPYASSGDSPGDAIASSPTNPVTGTGIARPSASDLNIASDDKNLKSTCKLTANYSYIGDVDNSIISWYSVDANKNGGEDVIELLLSGPQQTCRSYTTISTDIGKTIYFAVEPIDGNGVHGDIQKSDSVGPVKN